MFFQIFLGSYLSPMTQLKGRNFIKNSNVDFFTSLIKEGKFINAVKGLTIFIEENDEENFSNIFIDDSSKGYSRMIYAKNGIIVSENRKKKFVLFDGKVINIDKSRINTFKFDQIDFNLESFSSNSIIAPKIQETSSVHLLSCIFNEKFSLEKECKYNDLSDETKQELLKRFYKPFYIPVIALLCSFLLISGSYKPNYSSVKKYIFLFILLVLIISEASLRYSTKSSFSMIVYFLIPLLLFLSFYISIHKKIKNA
jgi:lipopolysaccharide export system permease protein